MGSGGGQTGKFGLAAIPYLGPDDIDARHLHPAEAAEGVTLHLHAPGQFVVFVEMGDVVYAMGFAPVGLGLEVSVGEETAPHVPEVGLGPALLVGEQVAVHRSAVAFQQCLEIGHEAIAFLLFKSLCDIVGPGHPLESRFVAPEPQDSGAQVVPQRAPVLLMCPVNELVYSHSVEIVAERVVLVFSTRGIIHATCLR